MRHPCGREQSGLAWLIGRGWPKPGAALGLNLPLRVPPGGEPVAELRASLFSNIEELLYATPAALPRARTTCAVLLEQLPREVEHLLGQVAAAERAAVGGGEKVADELDLLVAELAHAGDQLDVERRRGHRAV